MSTSPPGRQRAESRRELSDAQLRVAAEAAQLGLWSWEIRTGQVTWNEQMHTITGQAAPLDLLRWVDEVVHPDDRDRVRAESDQLEAGSMQPSSSRIVRPDGEVRWVMTVGRVLVDEEGQPTAVIGATLDVSDQEKAAKRLERARRMETLGHLAAGVAHNFNNMLMVIGPCLETLQSDVPPERQQLVRDALDASDRAAAVVRQLMLIAGQRDGTTRTHSIGVLVSDIARICRRTLAADMKLEVRLFADGELSCEDGSIEQVITNLILNARDALDGVEDPMICVTVDRELRFGESWSKILVEDNGPGIPSDVLPRIFEPFFTTKTGRGTGLGLATCQAIVARLGGQLACKSRPGRTEFLMLLPCAIVTAANAQAQSGPATPSSAVPDAVAEPLVLLVDDEPAIRRVMQLQLEGFGFRVDTAKSHADVVAHLETSAPADLVLLDRTLGQESGRDLVGLLREKLPEAKIFFFSGEPVNPEEAALVDGVASKPIRGQTLAKLLRDALE